MTTKPLVEVALKLVGKGFVPEDVTAAVQLTPTRSWRSGDRIQQSKLTRKDDAWLFGFPRQEIDDLDICVSKLLDAVEPHKGEIINAMRRFNLKSEISLAIYLRGETPSSFFAAKTIRRIADIEASLDLDLMLVD